MNKEKELSNGRTKLAASLELDAIRDAKYLADHGRGVSHSAKVTAVQEKDASTSERYS